MRFDVLAVPSGGKCGSLGYRMERDVNVDWKNR